MAQTTCRNSESHYTLNKVLLLLLLLYADLLIHVAADSVIFYFNLLDNGQNVGFCR